METITHMAFDNVTAPFLFRTTTEAHSLTSKMAAFNCPLYMFYASVGTKVEQTALFLFCYYLINLSYLHL